AKTNVPRRRMTSPAPFREPRRSNAVTEEDYGIPEAAPERSRTAMQRPVPAAQPRWPADELKLVQTTNTKFDGVADPMGFMDRVEELQKYYGVRPETLLLLLPEMLTDSATAWFRKNRQFWTTWDDFIADFRGFYLPHYEQTLEDQIVTRRQQVGEPGRDFVQVMQTMIRRHGGYSQEATLRRVYNHLLPEYRQYIRRGDFRNIRELVQEIEEFEQLQAELRSSTPRPRTNPPPLLQVQATPRSVAAPRNVTVP